jgi:RHS repeat-associated protein
MQMPGRKYNSNKSVYGFNGMRKDNDIYGESNAYDFGARMYDPRLGRWFSTDELEKKYPSISPFVFAINSPLRVIDVDGKDIIILSAPKGAGGFGHAAVLIGNDKIGWTLYSKNGTFGSSGAISSGPSNNNPEKAVPFASLSEFANSSSNFHHGEVQYTSAFRIASSTDVDEKMKAAAGKQVNKWYDVTGTVSGSCIDVCSDALVAGGFASGEKGKIEGGSYPGRAQIMTGVLKPMVPNERFKNIVEQNTGTDVTNQILPTEASKTKYKKENDDAEAAAAASKASEPSVIDRIKSTFSNIGQLVNEAVNKLSTPR